MEKKKQSPQKKASNNTNKNDNQRVNKNMDVRFKRIKNDEQKIVIDDRFKDMFTNPSFTSEYEVDKYGQKIDSSTAEDLKKFYSIEDEKEETKEDNIIEDKKAQKQPEKRSKSQILKDKIKNKATQVEKPKKAQLKRKPKEEEAFHWSDESSDDDDEEEEEDEDEVIRINDYNNFTILIIILFLFSLLYNLLLLFSCSFSSNENSLFSYFY